METAFRRRLIRGVTGLLVVFGSLTAFRYLQIGVPWMALADFVAIGVSLVSLQLLRDRVWLASHVLMTTVLLVLLLDNCTTGGFFDPNFGWLFVVPVGSGLLISGR